MEWLRRRAREWLRLNGDGYRIEMLSRAYTDRAVALKDANIAVRMSAAENSCRLIEKRLKMIEDLKVGDGALGELAARVEMAGEEADRDRLDASAAKLRGLTIEAYREQVAERRKNKAAGRAADLLAKAEYVTHADMRRFMKEE